MLGRNREIAEVIGPWLGYFLIIAIASLLFKKWLEYRKAAFELAVSHAEMWLFAKCRKRSSKGPRHVKRPVRFVEVRVWPYWARVRYLDQQAARYDGVRLRPCRSSFGRRMKTAQFFLGSVRVTFRGIWDEGIVWSVFPMLWLNTQWNFEEEQGAGFQGS